MKIKIIIILLTITFVLSPITVHASEREVYEDYLDNGEITNDDTRYYDIPLEEHYQKLIFDLCNEYGFYYESILSWIFLESSYDYNAVHYNSETSYDTGLTQINSKYVWWYEELAREYGLIEDYEPFIISSPTHQIKIGIAGLMYYRAYWSTTGLSSDEIFVATFNSYNMGTQQYIDWSIKNGTATRYYDKMITKYMKDLWAK